MKKIINENKFNYNYFLYKKTLNKKNSFVFILIILLIVLLVVSSFFVKPQKTKYSEFYFVEIDNFQTYKEAINLSQILQEKEAAGYIFFDEKYHVFASFYSTKNQAKKVCENLKNEYPNSQVFTIKSTCYSKQINLNSKHNKSIENFIKFTNKSIFQINDLSMQFFTKKTSFGKLKTHLTNHIKEFESYYYEFKKSFQTNSKFNQTKEYANNIYSSLLNLINSNEHNITLNLRFETVQIAVLYSKLCSCF